jgi:glycosyltransferase involved in cell wall biosynthesis
MLDQITPLILTYNEAPNIHRALEQLRWAHDIVVIDSFSNDETTAIAATFPQARVFHRSFDNHRDQWNFGLRETGITTEWVLALDADYCLTPAFVAELEGLQPEPEVNGFEAQFTYCLNGRPLRSGIYPPVTVLYRRAKGSYQQDGHTHRLMIDGRIDQLKSRILHDDRKSLSRWFESQQSYVALEAQKLVSTSADKLNFADRIRRLRVISPAAVLLYCLIIRGGVLDGWPGFYYAFQRTLAELLLSLYLLEQDFNVAAEPRRQRAVGSRQEAVGRKQPAEGSERSIIR